MDRFIEGRCPECNARRACAIDTGEGDVFGRWSKLIIDFVKSGLVVREFRTNKEVGLTACASDCRWGKSG